MFAVNGIIVCINGGMVLPSEYQEKMQSYILEKAGAVISGIIAAVFSSDNNIKEFENEQKRGVKME